MSIIDKTINTSFIKRYAFPFLFLSILCLVGGFALYFLGEKERAILSFFMVLPLLGMFLSVLAGWVLRQNYMSYRLENTSIGMNRYGMNSVDKGRGYYIFNQFIALSYFGMGIASIGAGIFLFFGMAK